MSRSTRKSLDFQIKDFTIHDHCRMSRRHIPVSSKLTELGKSLLDELNWDERDFDDPPSSDGEDESVYSPSMLKQWKSTSQAIVQNNWNARDYPIDLWYLIAMYIAPEDVGRFALLCRATNHVVNTVPFWIRLFRKYNQVEAKKFSRVLMREHLSVVRTHVIKSLYRFYPLFHVRARKTEAIQKEPYFLRLSRCIRIWHSKQTEPREIFNYYFEFRFDTTTPETPLVAALSPLFQSNNQFMIDSQSCLLHVSSSKFVAIGPYMGMILSEITLPLSGDYRYHKLKMSFDSPRSNLQNAKYNNSAVIIDPVLRLRVYHWYDTPTDLD